MKRKVYLFSFFVVIIFTLTACQHAGGDSKNGASTSENNYGQLASKVPSDFDNKFGYEVLVYQISDDSVLTEANVWISYNSWEKLPRINDSIVVYIEYLEGIKHYPKGYVSVCVGYYVDTVIKK